MSWGTLTYTIYYTTPKGKCKIYLVPYLVLERAHFISSSSFIEFQTVEVEHVSSSTFARVFLVLAQVCNTSFSGFFEINFSRVWVLMVKARRVFEFRVPRCSTTIHTSFVLWHFQIDQPSLALPRDMYIQDSYAEFVKTYKKYITDTATVMIRYNYIQYCV